MDIFSILPKDFEMVGKNKVITNLACDSRRVKDNGIFFAIDGYNTKGENYINEAIKNGAACVVTEKKLNIENNITQIIVPSSRRAMSEMASHFYSDSAECMLKIAVTGTNGKTSTTYFLQEMLTKAGYKVGVIGTNGSFVNDYKINSSLTTPDPIEFFEVIKQMKDMGVDALCFEASAHALYLDKLAGLKSDISILTNISQDHLDFFKTMFNYAEAKAKLFTTKLSKTAIINTNSPLAHEIYLETNLPKIAVGDINKCDIVLKNVTNTEFGQTFEIDFKDEMKKYSMNLFGRFNVENALNVIAVGEVLGINRDIVKKSIEELKPVSGRFNGYVVNGVKVIIDFAHTPEAMSNALTACRELTEGENAKLICVFGCGGNRDAGKRPLMGKTATNLCDYVILTNDNPRYEEPQKIINNIIYGISEYTNFSVELNRENAIKKAIALASKGDVVAILGKGCENYIEIEGEKIPYSDADVVKSI